MGDDGRLELDDDGLPLDARAADLVRDEPTGRPSRIGRALDAALTGPTPVSTAVRRVAAVAGVVALTATLVISTRTPVPALDASDVHGVSARVVPRTDASAPPRILASYTVSSAPGSGAVRIVGISGDAFTSAVETRSGEGTQSFLVEPDCDRLLATADGPAETSAYAVVLSPVGDRASTTSIAAFDGASALTAASERACWGTVATRSLRVASLTARPGRGPWTALDVVVRNSGTLPIAVTAVDVANVDTLSMADSRTIEPRTSASIRVRLPIATCAGAATRSPGALTWSVGAPGDSPSAFAATSLTDRQRAAVAAAARARCGAPPALTVSVRGSSAARDSAALDPRGLSVSLQVRVTTDAEGPVALGDDTSGLTADARPVFTGTTVRPGPLPSDAVVVWHTRCGSTTDDSSLPASTTVDGLAYSWSVPLAGASLPDLREAACR
jgi:hypothetical protein